MISLSSSIARGRTYHESVVESLWCIFNDVFPGLFIFHVGFYLGGILQIGVLHKCFWVSLSGLTSAGPAYLWSPEYQVAHRLVCCSNTVTGEAKPPSLDCAGQFGEILVQCIVSDVILPSYVESFPQESCIATVNSFLESLCDCPGFWSIQKDADNRGV